jgi:alpha-1,2-mannosyltransferase
MPSSAPYPRWLALGLIVLLAGLGTLSFDRAARGRFDFSHFYLDGRYVWEHGALNPLLPTTQPEHDPGARQLPFYLPVVPLLIAPLTAGGPSSAALAWAALQVTALALSLRMLGRWTTAPIFAFTLALALPALLEAAKFNQLSFFVLALVLGGLTALERRRPGLGGALLGIAAVLKLLPAIFLLWLVLKRQWRAVAAFIVVAATFALLPPLAAFGPRATMDYHRQWWAYNVQGESARGLLNPELAPHFIDRRNQSITQVLARLTWPEHPCAAPWQPVRLSAASCTHAAHAVAGLLLILLVWAARRPATAVGAVRQRAEFAVFALGMLIFSPLLRQYYLVWALPALLLVVEQAAAGPARRVGRAAVAVWIAGMLAWTWPAARELGATLATLLALGGLLLAATRGAAPRAAAGYNQDCTAKPEPPPA